MRHIAILLAVTAMAALPASGQSRELLPVGNNVLQQYLDAANVHEPVRFGPLSFFPISLARTNTLSGLLTMQEALNKGVLTVEELDSAEVSRARFVNKSRGEMIFLMAGEIITGGKQNRTLTGDALLAPGTSAVLALYCVQRGRWEGGKHFAAAPTVAPQLVREKAAQSAGQGEVWSEVARANSRMGYAARDEDLAGALASPEVVRRYGEYRRRVEVDLPRGTAGLVVAYGGEIIGADLFNSAELFSDMRQKVIDSYLMQHPLDDLAGRVGGRVTQPNPGAPGLTRDEVREYLRSCYRARLTRGEQQGVGQIYHVRGARFGELLAYEPPRILPAAESARYPIRAESYMVHAHLMREVVSVREPPPRPIPVPLPRPIPRPIPRPVPLPEPASATIPQPGSHPPMHVDPDGRW